MAWLVALNVFLALNGVIWLLRHVTISRGARRTDALGSDSNGDWDGNAPLVSVLVAAKDEQENIERCVRSLLNQDYPNFKLYAINDRSTDRTGEILHGIQAEYNGQMQVIDVQHLPEGWFGKNNAMRLGVEASQGQWLAFTDADCHFICPRTLSVAMRYAVDQKVDFLSILPVLQTDSLWERIIQPVCGAIMMFWFRPEWVNDPGRRTAYANGAFMLMHRNCYQRIGGHEAVKTEVNEDIHMARRAKRNGLTLCVMQNRGLYRTRMYNSFKACWKGWSRIFYGCFSSFWRLNAAFWLLAVMSVLPYVVLAASLVAAGVNGWQLSRLGWSTLILAAAATVSQQSVLMRFYELTGSKWYGAVSYPLGAGLALGMLISAMIKKLGGSVTWRGREYRLDQVVRG